METINPTFQLTTVIQKDWFTIKHFSWAKTIIILLLEKSFPKTNKKIIS